MKIVNYEKILSDFLDLLIKNKEHINSQEINEKVEEIKKILSERNHNNLSDVLRAYVYRNRSLEDENQYLQDKLDNILLSLENIIYTSKQM